jgi:hypothetical protein
MDDGHIGSNPGWQEIGLNASHMVGPHHVLFEGNLGFNFDSDKTHGNSIYHTVFRNWLTGRRTHFSDGAPKRAAGVAFYGYWMSFIGNVLGVPGGMSGWSYESTSMNTPAIFLLGWDDWSPYPSDPKVKATVLREGNFDYLTNLVHWDTTAQTLPPSLYLTSKPAFFAENTWPWVDPTGTTKLYTLPAKARYDAGTPVLHYRVTSISPVNGPIDGGTTVTIRGQGFVPGATVGIGGVTASGVVVTSPTTLTAVTGPHATGLADVTVTVPGPQSATLAQGFFYAPPPVPSDYYTLTPCRLVDTRMMPPALGVLERRVWKVTGGACKVPATAIAAALNVTVVGATAAGHIRLAPGNGLTESSAINFRAGQTRANNAVILLATDGTGGISATNRSTGTVHLILDVSGYFQ